MTAIAPILMIDIIKFQILSSIPEPKCLPFKLPLNTAFDPNDNLKLSDS